MKRQFLWLAAIVFPLLIRGQSTVIISSGTHLKSVNESYIVLNDVHLVNNGAIKQTGGNGTVKFTGNSDVNLSGTGITLDKLLLQKGNMSTVLLITDIEIVTSIDFKGGVLNLNDYKVNLGSIGKLLNESEQSRAFTTGTGYVEATGNLMTPSAVNLGNLGAIITSSANMGNTSVRRGHKVQMGISSTANSIQRYFDIIPANNIGLKAILGMQYFDAELNGIPENSLNHWKSKDNSNWELLGYDKRDATANYIEKKGISSFARWTLASVSSPVIVCPSNITINDPSRKCEAVVYFTGSNEAMATGTPNPKLSYSINDLPITSPYTFPKGITTVKATASNGIAPDASCTFTVTVTCNKVTTTAITKGSDTSDGTVKEAQKTTSLLVTVMPNPFNAYFTLITTSKTNMPINIRIIDALGRLVEAKSHSAANKALHFGQTYRPGFYYAEVLQGSERVILKLIKKSE